MWTFHLTGRGLVPLAAVLDDSGDQAILSHSQVTDQVSFYIPAYGNCIS